MCYTRLFNVLIATAIVFINMAYSRAMAEDSEVIAADGGVVITRAEFEAAIADAPERVLRRTANNDGERFEMINGMLTVRKLAAEADTLTPEDEGYWELQAKLLNVKQEFMFARHVNAIEVRNPELLAQEYYRTQKDKYATKPETRASSHILLASPPGLDRTEVRAKAQRLLDELRAGADWNAMVQAESADKGSAKRNGSLDRWITFGEPGITPPYSEALFEIDEIGAYSEITDSQFGVHIIRLDGIREGGYYEYEEVRPKILADIRKEIQTLITNQVRARYLLSEDAVINGEAMDEIFAPYKNP